MSGETGGCSWVKIYIHGIGQVIRVPIKYFLKGGLEFIQIVTTLMREAVRVMAVYVGVAGAGTIRRGNYIIPILVMATAFFIK